MDATDKRIVSFSVAYQDLQYALKEAYLSADHWKSRPIQVIDIRKYVIVIVEVVGNYPFMDSKLNDIIEKFDARDPLCG